MAAVWGKYPESALNPVPADSNMCTMCTLVILRRPSNPWPLLLAGNRDEMAGRPSLPPARHWEDRPEVIAGLDRLAGGSWLGLNDHGVVAVVMNREGTLGPAPGKRSRGELVLEALDHAEAMEAAQALAHLDPGAYRPFNLFVGDPVSAFWIRHRGRQGAGIEVREVPEGLHMLSAGELDDVSHPRLRRFLPRFRAAPVPSPEAGDWSGWTSLLGDRGHDGGDGATGAMTFSLDDGFGTRSSHLVALPRYPSAAEPPVFLYADGMPDQAAFCRVGA